MDKNSIVLANNSFVLREEFDDWALLFNPDSSATFGMNQIGLFIYKNLNGENSIEVIVRKLTAECQGAPLDLEKFVIEFIHSLVVNGLAEVKE